MLASGDLLAIFLSTPSARRATHQVDHVRHIGVISIHALREEGDWVLASAMLAASIFLSTPSARRATLHNPATNVGRLQFLSTPSARRATSPRTTGQPNTSFLSTPSARRATSTLRRMQDHRKISIHALREEGDGRVIPSSFQTLKFLSTPSARRATPETVPRGSRDGTFLSTPSARRATRFCRRAFGSGTISIHALREEGDG